MKQKPEPQPDRQDDTDYHEKGKQAVWESLFQVAYQATIQAEQHRHEWNGRKLAEQADTAWESFHNACDRFRRLYQPGLTAVDPAFQLSALDEDDRAVLEILTGPTKQEMIEAVHRFNKLITEAGYNEVDYETAADYLEASKNDPLTAYNEFRLCNPYSADEALTAGQRNRQ